MNDASTGFLLGLLFFLILLSAFFSSSETAMFSLNKFRLRHLRKHRADAERVARLLERPDRLIGVILIGNNAVNILAALVAGILFARWFGPEAGIWVTTILLTIIMLVFAEVTPKTLAAVNPERLAYPFSAVLAILLHPLSPMFWVLVSLNWVTNGILRLFGVNATEVQREQISPEELRTVVDEAGHLIPDQHQDMLLNILDLEQMTVDDIMVPRNEITGLDLEQNIEDVLKQILESDFTRLPVYEGDINHIVGTLHLRRMNRMLKDGSETITRESIKQFVKKPYFVPESTPLSLQLINFQKRKQRLGFVVDEYGEVMGLVTLDDLLEEIVGDYTTTVTDDEEEIVQVARDEFLVDGSAFIRDLNKLARWKLPTTGPKTISGLLVEHLEAIPDGPFCCHLGSNHFEVMSMSDKLIGRCRVWRRRAVPAAQPLPHAP